MVFADEIEDAVDEGVAAKVAEFAEGDAAAEVPVTVSVAAGTAERALAGDFDAEQWYFSGQYAGPRGEQAARV